MDLLKTMGAAGIALLCASAAQATTVTLGPVSAVVVTATCNGVPSGTSGCGTTSSRRDVNSINYGTPDSLFYSLGLGGDLVLDFSASLGATHALSALTVLYETTWGNRNTYLETLDAYVSMDGVHWGSAYALNNSGSGAAQLDVGLLPFRWLWLHDTTPSTTGGDGFDLNSLTVTVVDYNTPITPAPAAAVLLGSALLAGGALRRRNRRAA